MARKSLIARDEKRRKLYEKYKAKREELKANGDYEALHKLPKNSSLHFSVQNIYLNPALRIISFPSSINSPQFLHLS